ncbi:hypothetical protein EJ08DRAFT_661414 [Tothia fuscella]|uniref:Uncharacterized protein n=1 Tax=Tothia fuscella TaxID=1048955 RepID=A0A9P4NQD9_9PEZI|nr:hypothetical protein EJ08DRAFT_661414 [Tothia fuscella]
MEPPPPLKSTYGCNFFAGHANARALHWAFRAAAILKDMPLEEQCYIPEEDEYVPHVELFHAKFIDDLASCIVRIASQSCPGMILELFERRGFGSSSLENLKYARGEIDEVGILKIVVARAEEAGPRMVIGVFRVSEVHFASAQQSDAVEALLYPEFNC